MYTLKYRSREKGDQRIYPEPGTFLRVSQLSKYSVQIPIIINIIEPHNGNGFFNVNNLDEVIKKNRKQTRGEAFILWILKN